MSRLVNSFKSLSKDSRTVGVVYGSPDRPFAYAGWSPFLRAPWLRLPLSKGDITGERKTAVNYWFRHIWEYWWPLYPGVILAVALLEVETWRFMVIMIPMTVVSILAGIFFITAPIKNNSDDHHGSLSWPGIKHFVWEMMPILIVILFILFLTASASILKGVGFSYKIPPLLSILPGILASIIWVSYINHTGLSSVRSALGSKSNLFMLFLIVAIMLFKGIMVDSQAVVHIRNELLEYKIPIIALIIIMPFLSGFILGIAIGFVGASFPLIIPLFQSPDMLGLSFLCCPGLYIRIHGDDAFSGTLVLAGNKGLFQSRFFKKLRIYSKTGLNSIIGLDYPFFSYQDILNFSSV